MALINDSLPTLLDHAKAMGPDHKVANIIEMMTKTDPVLDDITFIEGNLPTGHQITQRTGLPEVYTRRANRGTPASKGRTDQITEGVAEFISRSHIDVKVANLNGNAAAYRASQQRAHLIAMRHKVAESLFYGNAEAAPDEFNGLSVRYSDLSAESGENIVLGGSNESDPKNTSMWLVCWSPETITGIFPKGSTVGLSHEDLGIDDVPDANGNYFRAYKDLWTWNVGIAQADWRYAVRIANIEVAALAASSGGPDLTSLLTKALYKIPETGMGRMAIYCNRTVITYLDLQRQGKVAGGGGLNYENVDGKMSLTFRGIPIRKSDSLLNTETLVA